MIQNTLTRRRAGHQSVEKRVVAPGAVVAVGFVVIAMMLMWPFVAVWAGDAIIHLRIAELFAAGYGFQYNLGEPGMATSSLLWTAFLSVLFRIVGPAGAAWAVKVSGLLAWAGTVVFTAIFWERLFRDRLAGLAASAVFAFSPAILHNAVGGMEASTASLITIVLVGSTLTGRPTARAGFIVTLTALLGLVRPEGVIFGGLLATYLAFLDRGIRRRSLAVATGAAMAAILTVATQFAVTGSPLPDSGASRMAGALRESIAIGSLHVHPTSAALFVLMLPITLGLLAAVQLIRKRGYANEEPPAVDPALRAALGFALALFVTFLVFYTFIFGGTHATRYWTPLYPIVLGGGAASAAYWLARWHRSGRTRTALILGGGAIIWLAGFYIADWNRRHTAEIGVPHGDVVRAVANRPAFTKAFLEDLGAVPGEPVLLAVTEVQVRYFLDDNADVYVSTLDGRTSTDFRDYVDEDTGLRKFAEFLRRERPDFVELVSFDPREPVLPEVAARWAAGEDEIEVDGFLFRRTGRDPYVRFLGER